MNNRNILIIFLSFFALIGLSTLFGYGTYKGRGDYSNDTGNILLSADEKELVFYNLDDPYVSDILDANTVSFRASESMTTTYYLRLPIGYGEPNSVLATDGVQNAQLRWVFIDANLWGDPNTIELPTLTPGSRVFVDANGFPLYEDNANAYFDDVNDFAGFALGHITGDPKPNNYIQVYKLLDFEPTLFNTTIGMGTDDTTTGPNNVRIGHNAGVVLGEGYENSLGGKDAGLYLVDANDNTGWGYKVIGGNATIPDVSPQTYTMTYISEGSVIWGIPINDGVMNSLDIGGEARNVGGGIVGLPWAGHPFTAGDIIKITNTTNYNSSFTLEAGTTANELQITSAYNAETFNGTENILKIISVPGGFGTMVRSSDGTLYYGHTWNGTTYITKVETDGTLVYDFLNHTWSTGGWSTIIELALSHDDAYIYIAFPFYLEKYELATGDLVWSILTGAEAADCAIDANDNIYIPYGPIYKYDPNGAKTQLTVAHGSTDIVVSDELGIVVSGGNCYGYSTDVNDYHNVYLRNLDDSDGAETLLGELQYLGSGVWRVYRLNKQAIAIYGDYIYVLIFNPTSTLYKLDTNLDIIASVAGPSSGQGIYFDLWGNLVVINQSYNGLTDVLYFYDTSLNYLSKIDNLPSTLLGSWALMTYTKGNAVFDGDLAVEGNPNVHRVTALGAYAAANVYEGADDGLYVGTYSGQYNETDPNRFFLDNLDRGDYPGNQQHGMMYGYFARDPNDQWLTFNIKEFNLPFARLDVNDVNISGELVLEGFSEGSVLFTDVDGLVTQDNTNFNFDDSNDVLDVNTVKFSGETASRLLATDSEKVGESTDLNSWVTGTANQITVTDDADGTITLALPQDYDTAATPMLGGLTIVNAITEFSTDGTFADNSDSAVPTEKAIKTFIDAGVTTSILELTEVSKDPNSPDEGETVIWMTDGTEYGDDGDLIIAATAGGVTKRDILWDFSAADVWKDFLLLETGDILLLEIGDKLILEN